MKVSPVSVKFQFNTMRLPSALGPIEANAEHVP